MSHDFDQPTNTTATELASLASEIRVRVLNCGAAGCLVETFRPIPVGTVAAFRITMGAREFVDNVRVVRCLALKGAGPVYHVGMEFLCVAPPYAGSVRYMVRREHEAMSGWLGPKDVE